MVAENQQLTIAGPVDRPQVTIPPAAHEARRVALQIARSVTEVVDASTQRTAAEALATVKQLSAQMEAGRKLVKEPVLAAGKLIDQTAKDFVADLDAEAKRLSLLVGTYQEAERRKAQAAQEEAARREQMIREEAARREREVLAAARAGQVPDVESALATVQDEADAAIIQERQQVALASVAAPDGVSVRKNWKFEVVDVKKLFAAHPELCVIEPNAAAIRAVIKHRQDIPGLRIWSETAAVATVRAATAAPSRVESYDY